MWARAGLVALMAAFTIASGSPAEAKTVKLVAFGDSLTTGYGLPKADSFAAKLEVALRARGLDVSVANAGVSGDTASMGLARLDWSIPADTDGVIVELGANDMLRGQPPATTRKALTDILSRLKSRGVPVLLAGMRAAPNMGADYQKAFDGIYPDLAREFGTLYYPFFLEGVAGTRGLNLPDGIHPTAAGIDIIVANILPKVEELVQRASRRAGQ